MSRYLGPFSTYSPGLVLSLRAHPEGGSILPRVNESFRMQIKRRQSDLLLLVHGYNNHEAQAQLAYSAFRSRKANAQSPETIRKFEDMQGDVFWPGDADWPGVIDQLDFMYYPKAVENAIVCVSKLVAYLQGRHDVERIHFIGHSLGCRVILEIIKRLTEAKLGTLIGRVCLMAAAVPEFKVFPGGDLYKECFVPAQIILLFSKSDHVLRYAFPVGQTLAAGDEGVFPTAIGLSGNVPIHPGIIEKRQIYGAAHGDYWGAEHDNAADDIAAVTRAFFRVGGDRRSLPAPDITPSRPVGSVRETSRDRLVGVNV